jgi:hypothetical protein
MKGCLGGVLFVIFLSVLDVLLGKVLPFEKYQTVRLILVVVFSTLALGITWRKRESLDRRVIA